MPFSPFVLPTTVSLFTRGADESVRITRDYCDGRVTVDVHGPGAHWERALFFDVRAALLDQNEREADLISRGFRLEAFITERRQSTQPWPHAERRQEC